jgi:Negative regulator of beta-lactamase expression
MQVDQMTGRLRGVDYVHSPNQQPRPAGIAPELVVIHGISLPAGQFGGEYVDQLFTNALDTQGDPRFAYLAGLRVSAHVYIRRDGRVTQFVGFNEMAGMPVSRGLLSAIIATTLPLVSSLRAPMSSRMQRFSTAD